MATEDGIVPEDYNPGQRMSMAQIQAMDENDDSLAAYKASLGLTENPIIDDTRPEKLLDFQFGLCFFSDDNGYFFFVGNHQVLSLNFFLFLLSSCFSFNLEQNNQRLIAQLLEGS